jgi:hypothetical protein
MLNHNNSNDLYNSLPDVIWANQTLHKHGRDLAVNIICHEITRRDLSYIFGVRLLHKHSEIFSNELMLEEESDFVSTKCLTTQPSDVEFRNVLRWPNSWKIGDGRLIPLEYSLDRLVSIEDCDQGNVIALVSEVNKIIAEFDVADILGLCVVRRSFYRHRPNRDAILVETTNHSRRANVVRYAKKEDFSERSLVVTTWIAPQRTVGVGLACNVHCEPGSCIPFSACVRDGDGNHSQETTHQPGPHSSWHVETGG